MKREAILGLALAAMLLTGWTTEGRAAGDPAKGKRKYHEYCIPCHGREGKGDGTRAQIEQLDPRPRNHTDGNYMNSRADVQLFKTIKEGGKATTFSHIMPQWKHILSDDDIWDVLAHVRSLAVPAWTGTPTPAPTAPATPAKP